MNRYLNYRYTLSPFFESVISDNSVEIDLNQSSDFGILFNNSSDSDSREIRLKRLDFLKNHSAELNLIAHITRKLHEISEFTATDMECILIYSQIINGDYGEEPVNFFRNDSNKPEIEKILYYLVQKKHNNKREYYFETVLKNLFCDKVYFYFDKLKKKLFVLFIAEETEKNKNIFNICRYFFADILSDIEVKWQVYPLIFDKTDYIIASEGEQLCGTII